MTTPMMFKAYQLLALPRADPGVGANQQKPPGRCCCLVLSVMFKMSVYHKSFSRTNACGCNSSLWTNVRVIRLVLRVSWCESQNASLQALFVCLYLDGGNVVSVHAALLRRRRKYRLSHKLRQSIWESNSLQITKPTLTSPTSPVQSMGCSNVNDG